MEAYFELHDEEHNHHKFWVIKVLKDQTTEDRYWVYRRWGRCGTCGQRMCSPPLSKRSAQEQADQLIIEKLGEGYKVKEMSYELANVLKQEQGDSLKSL